jgi:hypothetical protein
MRTTILALCSALLALVIGQCSSPPGEKTSGSARTPAWSTVYEVLQHPRCLNCHPAGDTPLVGERSEPHPQNVQRGADGTGLFAMRCAACHQTENTPGAHMPPGAPTWHLPHPSTPLVFEGLTSGELCQKLRDPAHNGGRAPEALVHHVEQDALVLWAFEPGEGRAPVSTPHADFVAAMRAWVGGGCDCPE